MYNLEDSDVWDLITDNGVLDLNDFWIFYYNFLPDESMIPQSLVTSEFCRNKYQFSTHMNGLFDKSYYGEIYLYQYANSCPRPSQYRDIMKGFPSHTKIEVRHSCCDCPPDGCGYWLFYLKGSGIWLDLGKTIVFWEHYEAFKFFLPDYDEKHTNDDLLVLSNAMREQHYDTIQFLANNEFNIFLFEILDARYKDQQTSCPSTTNYIYQFASKPYTCSCLNNECLNCKIKNKQFEGYFPPCVKCTQYKLNTNCLSSCPSGTVAKKAYYADEQYLCLYQNCQINGCEKCSSSGNECLKCYEEYTMKKGECLKEGTSPQFALKLTLIIWIQILFFLQI